jgi:hypothetical protein
VGSLERRLRLIEAERKKAEAKRIREALSQLSDEELEALEESLLAEARPRGEEPPPNDLLEEMKRWEAETIERQRRHTEESRRRDRELLERNRALIEAHRRRTKKGPTQ